MRIQVDDTQMAIILFLLSLIFIYRYRSHMPIIYFRSVLSHTYFSRLPSMTATQGLPAACRFKISFLSIIFSPLHRYQASIISRWPDAFIAQVIAATR